MSYVVLYKNYDTFLKAIFFLVMVHEIILRDYDWLKVRILFANWIKINIVIGQYALIGQ